MGKTQKSISIPKKRFKEFEELYEKIKDVCEELEISSASELLRVLANLGKPRFEQIVKEARKTRKSKSSLEE